MVKSSDPLIFIKALEPGAKRWAFVKPNGALTHLRIHAAIFTADRAAEVHTHLVADYPTWRFKITGGQA